MAAETSVRASVLVKAAVPAAFRVFTERTDAWWKRGPEFRVAGTQPGALHLEPFLHGRLFEAFDVEGVRRVVRTGRIQVWEPPHRLTLAWRAVGCTPNELSEVEVVFEPRAQETLVTLTNRDLPKGREPEPLRRRWDELLRSFAELANQV